MSYHEIVRIVRAATPSPSLGELVLQVPKHLKHRRLYGAVGFYGRTVWGKLSAELKWCNRGNTASLPRIDWEWGYPAVALGAVSPFRQVGRGVWPVPPFCTTQVQAGAEAEWLSTQCGSDSMVAVVPDYDFPASFVTVMYPIPMYVEADELRIILRGEWTTDLATFPDAGAWCVVGVRSSEVPL